MINRYSCPTRRSRRNVLSRRGLARPALLGIVFAGAAVVAGGVYLSINFLSGAGAATTKPGSAPQWAAVRKESIPVTVVAEGELVAQDQVDINNLIDHPDDETIESIVEEGTWVQKGDWLYTLNAPGLVSDRDQSISKVREAEAMLKEETKNLDIEKDTSDSEEDKVRLTLDLAKLAHKQWELGTDPQKVRDLSLAKEKAERELDLAKRELEFSKELFEQDFISRSELEQDEIKLIEAENAMETAKLTIEVYDKYEKVKQEKELLSNIKQAEDELERTIRKNQNKEELLLAKIETQKNELDQRQARLNDLERMVGNMNVTAPLSGMVIYSSTIGVGWEKYRVIRPGTSLRGGQRVLVLSNTSQLIANLFVHESRINEINTGQEVIVSVNARPGKVFSGKVVGKKNSAVQESGANPHLRQYQVAVQMPTDLGIDIRPGMNCSGEIYIREIPSALAVPVQAVHTEGREHFVFVQAEGNKVRRQPIRLGGASDTLVQVKAGLEEGAQILLRSPRPGEVLALSGTLEPDPNAEPEPVFSPATTGLPPGFDPDHIDASGPSGNGGSQSDRPHKPRGEFGGNGGGGSGGGGGGGGQRPPRSSSNTPS